MLGFKYDKMLLSHCVHFQELFRLGGYFFKIKLFLPFLDPTRIPNAS